MRDDGFVKIWNIRRFYRIIITDPLVKSQNLSFYVIPAKAGIQSF